MSERRTFSFQTEFTPEGDVISGPQRNFFSRDEAEKLAASARAEGEARAKAAGFAGVDRIIAHLSPVQAQLADLADTLRREAAELAMIAARKIAGGALDANGAKAAADAIAECARLLKNQPSIVVSIAPSSLAEVEQRLEQLRRQGR